MSPARSFPPLALLLACFVALGCGGVSVGDEGDEGSAPCLADTTKVPVTDATATPMGFTESAEALLAPTRETLVGTLTLDDGQHVPMQVTMNVVPGTLQAVYGHPADDTVCKPWLEATLKMKLDAGEALRGEIEGELDMRVDTQIRIGWVDVTSFQATPEVPDFGDEVSTGPAITGGLLRNDDGTWSASFQFAAHVPVPPCNEKTEMCTGTPNMLSPVYEPLGEAELAPTR